MRFKRGTRVEVLDRKELPLGYWRCGEIISVNRHCCTVRYYGKNRKNTLAKVSSSVVRPSQPHLGSPKKWVPGDVLEVFNDFSWKMGKVMKSLGRNSFAVQILGTSEQFRVDLSETRVRHSWHNSRWIVIGQVTGISGDGECEEDGQVPVETQKSGALKKHGICTNGRKCGSGVIANQTKWHMPIDVSLRIQDSAAGSGCSFSHSESSNASSTGSCSTTDNKCCASSAEISPPAEDISGNMNDAESCNRFREQKSYICSRSGLGLEAEVHSLELHAYRRTMEALHASGALTWDKESLMSNLRVSLNISSEEHLAELRDLLSAKNDDTAVR